MHDSGRAFEMRFLEESKVIMIQTPVVSLWGLPRPSLTTAVVVAAEVERRMR
jgi:hypothetical protein